MGHIDRIFMKNDGIVVDRGRAATGCQYVVGAMGFIAASLYQGIRLTAVGQFQFGEKQYLDHDRLSKINLSDIRLNAFPHKTRGHPSALNIFSLYK